MNDSADLVMYWWDHAAELLTREGTALRRFGFVTTNSISQSFQRRTLERHLNAPAPISLVYAIPDHPWTRATPDAAAVRIAMTVAQAGTGNGRLLHITRETGLDTDDPALEFRHAEGRINANLTIGLDLTRAEPLLANRGLCSPGVKLHGAGFIVGPDRAQELGLGRRPGLEAHIRPYRNGRDIAGRSRGMLVIDLYPLQADEVRARFPEVYQHLLATVKPHRDRNTMAFRREHWWWFGATHEMYRNFTAELPRFIATPETAKHRIFVFLPSDMRADNMLVNMGLDDAFHLGVMSSRPHLAWTLANGAVLEDRPRYTKSACFDPFPFPDPPEAVRRDIRKLAEELDATRKQVQAEHGDLTLTGLYNVLDRLRAGDVLGAADRDIAARGRVLILKELHDRLDALAARAYGWPEALSDADMLARLAALNAERVREEAAGQVRWLRASFQRPRFGGARGEAQSREIGFAFAASPSAAPAAFPTDRSEQPLAVLQMLATTGPADAASLARRFRRGGRRLERRIDEVLATLSLYGRVTAAPGGAYLPLRVA